MHRVVTSQLRERVLATGELRPNEAVDLSAEVSGKVAAIHFREGQRVGRGDLLVKIDDRDLQARLQRARAERDLARKREQRARVLLEEQTISQELYEEASTGLEVLDSDIDLLEVQILDTEVRAPFAGVVGLRNVSLGSYVTPGSPIARLQSLEPIKLDFAVPEKYSSRVGPGIDVSFTVEGGGEAVRGEVYAVEPTIDPETRTLTLRARSPNPGQRLLPGAFARVELVLETAEDAVMIPSIALVPAMDSVSVYVVTAEDRAQPRVVRTGVRTEDRVEIVSGLEIGERVVVSGLERVSPGVLVSELGSAEAGGSS